MISITLNYATATELRAALLEMLGTAPAPVAPAAPAVEQEAPKAPKPAKAAKAAPVEAPKAEAPAAIPAVTATATATTPTESAPSEPATASPSEQTKPLTLEEVRAVLAKISQGGKAAEVKALIASYGVTALSAVPADKYSDVLEKAAAL